MMLYLMLPSGPPQQGQGLLWPEPSNDPARTALVAWEQEVDGWNGDEILAAVEPWFLATTALCDAIVAFGLTGLRIGNKANIRYSDAGKAEGVGEVGWVALPDFHIVVPQRPIAIRTSSGRNDQLGGQDDLRYEGWAGEDFSYSTWGPVVTDGVRELLKSRRAAICQLRPVEPQQGSVPDAGGS